VEVIAQTLFSNGHFTRWLRLGLGLFVGYQALVLHDAFAGIIAALFLFQAFTNTGCYGAGGCTVAERKTDAVDVDQVAYEEVKSMAEEHRKKP
jgi:hypothetical protein